MNSELTEKKLLNKNFILLLSSSILTGLAISQVIFAISWYIITELNRESSLGVVLIFAMSPRIVFILVGGALADKFDKRSIMFTTDFLRGALLVSLAVLFYFDNVSIVTLCIAALIYGLLDALFWPASSSLTPQLVHSDNLLRANSILQTSSQIAMLSGSIIVGVLLTFMSFYFVFFSVGIILLFSSFLVKFISINREQDTPEVGEHSKSNRFSITTRKIVSQYKTLFLLVSMVGIFNLLIIGPLEVGIPIVVNEEIQGTALYYSLLEATFSIGLGIGAILVGILNRDNNKILSVYSAVMLTSIMFIIFSQVNYVILFVLILFIMGCLFSMINVNTSTLIQQKIPQSHMGRSMSLISLLTTGMIPFSYALASFFLGIGFPIMDLILLFSSILLLLSIVFAGSYILTSKKNKSTTLES